MAKDITLMCTASCAYTWRVKITLEEKKLRDYNLKLICLEKNEQKSKPFLDINPRAWPPAFKDGNRIVNETLAACLYLESAYKSQGTQLIPDDLDEQAVMYQRILESNMLKDKIPDVLFYDSRTPEQERSAYALEKLKASLTFEVKLWESYMQKIPQPTMFQHAVQLCMKAVGRLAIYFLSMVKLRPLEDYVSASYEKSGHFLAGKTFSLADVAVFPMIASLLHFGLRQEHYPAIMAYYNSLKCRPSITATGPPLWPEAPNGTDSLNFI